MSLFRPDIERIEGYTPGEQPQESGWVKLNTNENPYPPSPRVVEAIRTAAEGRLNVYPDPLAVQFCRRAAELFDVSPDWILPANGSDENLTILMRTFVDPGELIAYPYPSYVLYETLADLQGARHWRLALNADWSWDHPACREVVGQCKLVFVPNPNSPSGNRWADDDVLALVPPAGILVLDEAYGDFCDRPHRAELLRTDAGRRIVITRSLSKSYSLAGVRCGFAVAHPELIAGMRKVKDSYNCNSLSLAAALAALEDQQWMQQNARRTRQTRDRMTGTLRSLGFDVVDSQANFVWATCTGRKQGEGKTEDGKRAKANREIFEALKRRRILVRYMRFPGAGTEEADVLDGLRISVGTDDETNQLLAALAEIV